MSRSKRYSALSKAAGALGLGAAFALGSGEAFAGPQTMIQDGVSYFNVGNQSSRQLESGAMELTFESGESIIIPAGEYGYNAGDLYISEKHLPYELAHAVLTPEQVNGYIFSKTATAEGLAPIPTSTAVDTEIPGYLEQFFGIGAIVLLGAAVWWVLTKIGDAPEFEYPIYTVSVEEGTSGVFYTAQAKDFDSAVTTYSLRDDLDAYDNEFFTIDPTTGELSFITPPNFEAPADNNFNNVYDVKIDAKDNDGGIGSTLLHVTVTDDGAVMNILGDPQNIAAFVGSNAPDDVQITDTDRTFDVSLDAGQDYLQITGGINAATIDMGADNDLVELETTGVVTGTINLGAGDDRIVLKDDIDDASVTVINLGTGSDRIVFETTDFMATTAPAIQLFTDGDKIDLSALNISNFDSTTYGTALAATTALGANDVTFYEDGVGNTIVYVDSDSDGVAEIQFELEGFTSLDASDFLF